MKKGFCAFFLCSLKLDKRVTQLLQNTISVKFAVLTLVFTHHPVLLKFYQLINSIFVSYTSLNFTYTLFLLLILLALFCVFFLVWPQILWCSVVLQRCEKQIQFSYHNHTKKVVMHPSDARFVVHEEWLQHYEFRH